MISDLRFLGTKIDFLNAIPGKPNGKWEENFCVV
jgi:hypothetical protein